ncbi:methyltransferase [Actinoplanes friuliensis]|uniref:Methyltransferase n=1 Tax=Actinoplanes friuliensis DSM 7358 TaxID=1246995 RepID=U5VZA1_9ACTN|nr:methyltransferase [Actinoplanes friuliensis]AGZ42318.1 methyltransferase [Actinoplanes friuliensis DSM 7358]
MFLREPEHLTETRAAWDAFAGRYAERFRDEFAAKVWDRALLSGWAELAGGVVALAFQVGDETLVRENITFRRRRPEHVAGLLTAAGLTMVLTSVREPSVHPGLTEAVPQAYLVARRP